MARKEEHNKKYNLPEQSWVNGQNLPDGEDLSSAEQDSIAGILEGINDWSDDNQVPNAAVKANLMAAFKKEHQKKGFVWLNGFWAWIWPAERSWYKTPAFQMMAIASCVTVLFMFVNNTVGDDQQHLALVEEKPESERKELDKAKSKEDLKLSKEEEVVNPQIEGLEDGLNNQMVSLDAEVKKLESEPVARELTVTNENASTFENNILEEEMRDESELEDLAPAPPDGYFYGNEKEIASNAITNLRYNEEDDKRLFETDSNQDRRDMLGKDVVVTGAVSGVSAAGASAYPNKKTKAQGDGLISKRNSAKAAVLEDEKLSDVAVFDSFNKDLDGAVNSKYFKKNIEKASMSLKESGDLDLINILYTAH